jgi:protocatechuate 3,4-dioxygenase, beta subunit
MLMSKRRLLAHGGAWSAGLLTAAGVIGQAMAAATLLKTRAMALGPYYPVERPVEEDADLTRLPGQPRATGRIIELAGRVLRPDGSPVAGARVEIWQASAAGRYRHQGDADNKAPIDPGFQGAAVQKTDAEGAFRFLTVKPAPYPSRRGFLRAPHIHFDVEGQYDRLVTQMYFPGEPELGQDKVLLRDLEVAAAPKDWPRDVFGRVAAGASKLEAGADIWRWDIVVANG